MPKPITDLLNLLGYLKFMVRAMVAIYHVQQFGGPYQDHSSEHTNQVYVQEDEDRPSPLMVPVPLTSHVVLIKKKLPVVEFSDFLERSGMQQGDKDLVACAICLSCIEESQEIRELSNCTHLFHRECLDGWVDQGHVTCPLCRFMLLPSQGVDTKGGSDPWWVERIAYLFGEDYELDAF